MNKFTRPHEQLIHWLHAKLHPRQFLVVSSILVGLSAGLAAVMLKTLVHFISSAIAFNYGIPFEKYLYVIFPAIGIFLTVFVIRRFFRQKLGRGTSNILYAIGKRSSFLPFDQMYSHIATSAITVGFGGSAGLESPIVTTGAAIGSNYARTYKVNYMDRTLLLASGAAAGIAAAFNAPIAGVLFAFEVLLTGVSMSAFIPLLIAAASGALVSKIILQEDILLSFKTIHDFNYKHIPAYIVLGILCGFLSHFYSKTFTRLERRFEFWRKGDYRKAITAGALLALLILVFPPLFGEGYESIKWLAAGNPTQLFEKSIFSAWITSPFLLFLMVSGTMLFKVTAASFTISGGGNGGNFAPSLFVGAYLGFCVAFLINMTGFYHVPISHFTVVGMAGILSGIFYAPLTGIFLIAEITGGYELMIPLMLVSALSFTVVRFFSPWSMDAAKFQKKAKGVSLGRDMNVLSQIRPADMVEDDFEKIRPETTLGELTHIISISTRNLFPVVNGKNKFEGVIRLDDIRTIMFNTEKYDSIIAKELMVVFPVTLDKTDDMESVIKKFDESGAWNLPFLEDGFYKGFISKSTLFTHYRNKLIKSEDHEN